MLKKQTVWLLTMLSLMIVLSVYYMTSDSEDLAYIDTGENSADETVATDQSEATGDAEVDEIANLGKDELFTTLRMELQDDRSMEKERLNEIVASSTASPEEKDQALQDIDVIEEADTKESVLEEMIQADDAEYQDVLVRASDDTVHVHVKVNELSRTEVVNIMQLVRDEFGEVTVDVNFQPVESE
ncbi:SpoIIIAH-like family protein [Virgibacillus ainsalahensis]